MRRHTPSSNKKIFGTNIPQPKVRKLDGPNPFDFNGGRKIENYPMNEFKQQS